MTILKEDTPTSDDVPSLDDTSEIINIKVIRSDNCAIAFRIKMTTPLERLMFAYCEKCDMPLADVRFQYGERILFNFDTPSLLNMQDGDIIYAIHLM